MKKVSVSTLLILAVAGAIYFVAGPKSAEKTPTGPEVPTRSAAPAKAEPAKAPGTTSTPAAGAKSAAPTEGSATGTAATRDESAIRFGTRQATAKPTGTIRLATYNIENLFDAKPDGNSKASDEKPKDHRAAAAWAIHQVNADVLALEEVESKEALIEFRDQYLSDMGYTFVSSIDAGDPRGIEQSVLSRFPLSGEKNWMHAKLDGVHLVNNAAEHAKAGEALDLKRSPLHVVVTVPAEKTGGKPYEFTLYVMHHKAGKEFGYFRTAEAKFIAAKVLEEEKAAKDRKIAVLGDFNAPPQDESVVTYTSSGLVDAFKDRVKDGKWYTHQSGRSIDYIMTTGNFQADVVPETRFILGMPLKPQKGNWNSMPYPAGYASDHLPVSVDVKVK